MIPYSINSVCEKCDDDIECVHIYEHDKHCLDNFDADEIANMVILG